MVYVVAESNRNLPKQNLCGLRVVQFPQLNPPMKSRVLYSARAMWGQLVDLICKAIVRAADCRWLLFEQ